MNTTHDKFTSSDTHATRNRLTSSGKHATRSKFTSPGTRTTPDTNTTPSTHTTLDTSTTPDTSTTRNKFTSSGTRTTSSMHAMRDAEPPTLPRPRMPLAQRAKIFIPFDPLKGYQEALREEEREAEARMNEHVRLDDPA